MDAHDSDVCVNVVGKSLEAVRLLTTAAYLLHQIIPWTKEEKQ